MALTQNTNCGFVSSAPVDDPAGSSFGGDTRSFVHKDTAPAGATKITEVGWYCDNATEEGNFEVGLYAADGAVVPGEAGTRLYVSATNAKGTNAGWKKATVDWNVTAGTAYWIAFQVDDTATGTSINSATSGGAGADYLNTQTTLNDPYGGGAIGDTDALWGVYALYTTGGATGKPSIMARGIGLGMYKGMTKGSGQYP